MAPHPLVGKEAPAVTLPNQDSVEVTITPGADKKPVAIFFYPASGECSRSVTSMARIDVDV